MDAAPSEKSIGVNIGGGQTSIAGSVVGRDLNLGNVNIYEAALPRIEPPLHQLPSPPGDFTGRESELLELREGIESGGVHISGLQGQGGIGKTALALKLAAELTPRYPDGQIYLDLKGVSQSPLTPSQALAHVIRSFHPDAAPPDNEADLPALYYSVLNKKRVLLLMDNARDASQVQPLIPPAGSTLLVTSRTAFTLPGLKQKKLDTLSADDARKFLLQIAPRIGSAANAIADSCGYLALALRLAATSIAERVDLDPTEHAKKLADESKRLQLLAQAGSDPSMEASITLSYQLLDDEMQMRWRILGVFPHTLDNIAAASMWDIGDEIAQNALSRLLQFSMLEWNASARRYRLHDLMRAFARGKLTEGERNNAGLRHAKYYLEVLGRADDLYEKGGESMTRGLALFDLEWGNIQTGQAWASGHAGSNREAAQLCNQYPNRGSYTLALRQLPREKIEWRQHALDAARTLKDRLLEGAHLGNLGLAYYDLRDYRMAIEYHTQCLAIYREVGNRQGEGRSLGNLGVAYVGLEEHTQGIDYSQQALDIARDIGDRLGVVNSLSNLSVASSGLRDFRRAMDYAEQGLALACETGNTLGESKAWGNLGNAHYGLAQYSKALEYHQRALDLVCKIGDQAGKGAELSHIGKDYFRMGEYARAIQNHEQHLAITLEMGNRLGEGNAEWNIARTLNSMKEQKQALEHAKTALAIYDELKAADAIRVRAEVESWLRQT